MSINANFSQALVVLESHNNVFIKFKRPARLNSWNSEMTHVVSYIINRAAKEKQNIIFYGEGRAFSAGCDILGIAKGNIVPSEIFRYEVETLLQLTRLETHTVALMNGITMGAGAGLAWGCSIRVSTPNTVWAMPETSIGFCPDVGASYFLNKVNPPELGLYLQLTGEKLNGVDCYLFGFSHYHIEEKLEKVRKEIFLGEDIVKVFEKYHIEPDTEKSTIMPVLKDLRECFNIYHSLEFIIYKLKEKNTPWSLRIYSKLQKLCPLSLRVAYESFRRGRNLSYMDCLKMEYNLGVQMTSYRSTNFKEAIQKKMINKSRAAVNWIPNSIVEIGDSTMIPYFTNEEGPKLESPKL
ncbi:unnamed protein product [Blepharisma stoltei]|uniref:3-hydroxyisobutyryl-CoA hydrolase n=1 Tax=Blepharisma stoltei TaxID=1481888 RepID=A0AAU9J5A2_9CILI|nr:unnamed protein product [Blepharisma stoltei]